MFETFKLTDQSIIDKPSAKNANDTTRNLRLIVLDVQHVKNFNLNLNQMDRWLYKQFFKEQVL